MTAIVTQILDSLASTLTGITGVDTFIDDPSRLVTRPDGLVLMLEWEEAAGGIDSDSITCLTTSYLPILITIYTPRLPGDPPFWQTFDPIYVELHNRLMTDRTVGGLAIDTRSISRTPESGAQGCSLQCRYSVEYRTRQEDVELQ